MSSELLAIDKSQACLSCGACCAYFRVSFYWSEAEQLKLPDHAVIPINALYSCLSGTEKKPARCFALQGTVGQQVSCQMYEQRPSPCHAVQVDDEQCQRARKHYGLVAL